LNQKGLRQRKWRHKGKNGWELRKVSLKNHEVFLNDPRVMDRGLFVAVHELGR